MISKIINNKHFRLFGVLGLLYFLFTQNGNGDLASRSFKYGINDFKNHLHTLDHNIQMAKNQNKKLPQDSYARNNNNTLQKEQDQELLTSEEKFVVASSQLNQKNNTLSSEDGHKQSMEFLETQEKAALEKVNNEIQYISNPINQSSSLDKNQIKCGDEVKILISVIASAGKVLSRNVGLTYVYGSNKNKIIEKMLYNSTLNSIKIAQIPRSIALTDPEVSSFVRKQDLDSNSSMLVLYAEIKEFKSLKSC
jgi:hypothetical protein